MVTRPEWLNIRFTGFLQPRLVMITPVLLLIAVVPFVVSGLSGASLLASRHLQISDSSMGSTSVNYEFSFDTITSGPIGSIAFEVCSNYQYNQGDPCTPPIGFDSSAAVLVDQTGIPAFTVKPGGNTHKIVLVRGIASVVTPQQLTFELSDIVNPSNVGSYYVRIQTFASTDGNGPETDYGVVVFAINEGIGITTEVPPYLLFCTGITIDAFNCGTAAGSFISFGELSSKVSRSATSQLLASTNAPYGYSVTLAGTTMTAGNNIIPAMVGNLSQVGTSQFGVNSRQNTIPVVGSDPDGPGLTIPRAGYNTPNQYRFVSGDIIASSNDTDDYRKLTMSYIVNVSANQSPGQYVATISYICLANF